MNQSIDQLSIPFLVLAWLLIITACKTSKTPTGSSDNSPSPEIITSSAPPFSTREPERYRATRLVSITESDATHSAANTQTSRVIIARDGEKRREEYVAEGEDTIVYLETAAGQFILLPSRKLYAQAEPSYLEIDSIAAQSDVYNDFSADRLVNEYQTTSSYQKLGAEMVNGTMTAKYRVTPSDTNGSNLTETLIWIDEALGLPIRSETTSNVADNSTKVVVVLTDIRLEVADHVFDLPKDYKKVSAGIIRNQMGSDRAGKPLAGANQK